MRDAVGAAGGQPFERREALAELEAGRAVVGVPARDAAIDQQAAQGDDEGLQAQAGDEEAVDRAQHHAAGHDDEHGEPPVELPGHEQVDEDDAEQGEHRADRKVDAAGDDDEALADREQAEQPDEIGGVAEIDRRDEARIEDRHDAAHDQDEQEKAEILLQHDAASASCMSCGRRRAASRSPR